MGGLSVTGETVFHLEDFPGKPGNQAEQHVEGQPPPLRMGGSASALKQGLKATLLPGRKERGVPYGESRSSPL